ncbi:Citrate transporter [uncultured archaeon]|nr:Citrate transporter [uncultured archaeon]
MLFPVAVLAVVFVLIAVRRHVPRVRLHMWQIMLGGCVAVLVAQSITFSEALYAVDYDVILFLFCMFVVGAALEESGYLAHLTYKVFRRASSVSSLILSVVFVNGVASAFLLNDTLAIIGTPIVLLLARTQRVSPKLLLLALAFGVTTGSVMSPIGNPQNLLVALNGGVENPFLIFFKALFIPTLINLFVCYLVLKFFFRDQFNGVKLVYTDEKSKDPFLASLTKLSLSVIILLVVAKVLAAELNTGRDIQLTYIALAACLPILIFSSKRFTIMRKVDWHTLIFFASMFILMEAVWTTGFFQNAIKSLNVDITSTPMILAVSIILSQFISNVPLVALYLPMLREAGATTQGMLALAAGSTIAGNLLILGAASNIIIIQHAEETSGETISFREFAKIGVPLTAINAIVYWLFLRR